MSNSLEINWNKLSEHGKNTLKNSEDFEKARLAFIKIIASLDECWKGIDADAYKASCNSFLNDLRKDTLYFEELGKYFDIGSKIYSTVVEVHTKNIERLNDELEEKDRRGDING